MKNVEAIPVCKDCNCVMFKKQVQGKYELLEGWACPECYTTRWNDGL